jgi:hypothetical protein
MLFAWQDSWSAPGKKHKAILFVTFAQMLCGIAKDLTKLGGKTVTKLVTPDERQSQLFRLVSLITGWKNSLKGTGPRRRSRRSDHPRHSPAAAVMMMMMMFMA